MIRWRQWALGAAVLLAASGCGDDPQPQAARPAGQRAAKPAAAKPAPAATGVPLTVYEKIPDELRTELSLRDFQPDPNGNTNRDPFIGYVIIGQFRIGDKATDTTPTRCNEKTSVAENYAIRDLKLIGIVLRGTRSYALFRDTADLGHIVRRGQCLGKERAIVQKIGAGFVRLELAPETPPGGAPLPVQEREILLHPEEYELPTEVGAE